MELFVHRVYATLDQGSNCAIWIKCPKFVYALEFGTFRMLSITEKIQVVYFETGVTTFVRESCCRKFMNGGQKHN